jgi:hypothetical protein
MTGFWIGTAVVFVLLLAMILVVFGVMKAILDPDAPPIWRRQR